MSKLDYVDALVEVGVNLLAYCESECASPWACDGCPIRKAKSQLQRLELSAYLPGVTATLETEEIEEIEQPHLMVIEGGHIK